MVMKIEEQLEFDAGYTRYKFNAVSEHDGIRLWLTDWEHKIEGMKLKRWSHIGDDGSFYRREDIVIPQEVMDSVRAKVAQSIYFE
jgi:hypothetical protein